MASPLSAEDAVEVHTDGACSGNPGPGGWGAVLRWRGRRRELSGFEPADHQQPHGAAGRDRRARGAQAADDRAPAHRQQLSAQRHHDLAAGLEGATAGGPPTRSRSRTRIYGARSRRRSASIGSNGTGCRGHSGNPDNERADQLAREAIRAGRSPAETAPSRARGSRESPRRCSSRPGSGRPRPAAS